MGIDEFEEMHMYRVSGYVLAHAIQAFLSARIDDLNWLIAVVSPEANKHRNAWFLRPVVYWNYQIRLRMLRFLANLMLKKCNRLMNSSQEPDLASLPVKNAKRLSEHVAKAIKALKTRD